MKPERLDDVEDSLYMAKSHSKFSQVMTLVLNIWASIWPVHPARSVLTEPFR